MSLALLLHRRTIKSVVSFVAELYTRSFVVLLCIFGLLHFPMITKIILVIAMAIKYERGTLASSGYLYGTYQ